ncbi:MAG: methylmalonyl-CoA mutase subunit beta, partial [Rhodobacterales bacterium]|nr:methylmalonyl-CoA mutase subunit beta [Rhodobacterales bacterium]
MSGDTFPLAGEFPTPSRDEWLSLVDKALKGAPFDKMLVSRTYDGITIQPLYGRGDRPGEGDPSGFPGAAPFTRGARAAGATAGWDVRQLHLHPDPGTCNAEIRRDIERGVTSLRLRLHAAARRGLDSDAGGDLTGEDGVIIDRLDDLDRALKDIDLVAAPVSLEPGAAFAAGAALMAALWRRRGIADGDARGTFGADPLGTLAAEGALTQGLDDALAALGALAAATAATYGPGVRSVMVDTRPYHGAGATSSQDLAIAMATGVAYLRALTAAGMDIDAACGQIAFTLAVDCNQFQSIAKLRAARRLWARVTQACGASDGARGMVVNAETAHRMLTRRDPWVNMLRATVAAFAAGVGGADSVTVLSFDSALGEPGELGRRMARNTQLVLQEESNLHRVIDPAGGAWYPEHLTDDLCTAAWALFQEIEGKGGMAQALTSGWIGQTLDAAFAAREKNLDKRKDPLTGVSEFPNIHEAPVSPEDVD